MSRARLPGEARSGTPAGQQQHVDGGRSAWSGGETVSLDRGKVGHVEKRPSKDL